MVGFGGWREKVGLAYFHYLVSYKGFPAATFRLDSTQVPISPFFLGIPEMPRGRALDFKALPGSTPRVKAAYWGEKWAQQEYGRKW